MTFACEQCGTEVEVAVRRNHRFCASCRQVRRDEQKSADDARRRAMVAAAHAESNWAEREVARILGVDLPDGPRTHCQGCGTPLAPRAYRGGMSKRWCSERCRMRIARRGLAGSGSGYFGVLLADPCVYCGDRRGLTVDHIDPSSSGGADEWANLVGACQECNSQKGKMRLLRYLLARPLYAQLEQAKSGLAQLREAA